MGSILRTSGVICYSILYFYSRLGNRLKYLYSVISVDKRLSGNGQETIWQYGCAASGRGHFPHKSPIISSSFAENDLPLGARQAEVLYHESRRAPQGSDYSLEDPRLEFAQIISSSLFALFPRLFHFFAEIGRVLILRLDQKKIGQKKRSGKKKDRKKKWKKMGIEVD